MLRQSPRGHHSPHTPPLMRKCVPQDFSSTGWFFKLYHAAIEQPSDPFCGKENACSQNSLKVSSLPLFTVIISSIPDLLRILPSIEPFHTCYEHADIVPMTTLTTLTHLLESMQRTYMHATNIHACNEHTCMHP